MRRLMGRRKQRVMAMKGKEVGKEKKMR